MPSARSKKASKKTKPRGSPELTEDPRSRLLDAAERLLIDSGYAAISTRLLSKEAGLNHGLVHYYYGSMEELFLAVLERFTARLIVRQRAMYAANTSFLVKWRKAMGFLEVDLAAGYPKILFELQAMGWNRPEMRKRVVAVVDEWRAVLTEAFGAAMKQYGIEDGLFSVEAMVALVVTFQLGMEVERLSGISIGHGALLRSIDRYLTSLEEKAKKR